MTEWDAFLRIRSARLKELATTPPQAVTVEPRGACSLACKFCYVEKKTGTEVPVERVAQVLDDNPTAKILYVYGGDICDNHEWAARLLEATDKRKVEVRASTGAARLSEALAERLSLSRVRLQVSLEPKEWGLRVNSSGRHAFDIVAEHGNLAKLFTTVRVNTVIPTSTVVPEVPIREYLDRLNELFDGAPFTASYAPEGTDSGRLPDWWHRWIGDDLLGPDYVGKRPLSHFNPDLSLGAVMTPCGASQTPVVGPDGRLYSCHAKAADMDPAWLRDERHDANVERWGKMMDNEDCKACPAHYACGGICHIRPLGKSNPECQFMVSVFDAWSATSKGFEALEAAAAKRAFWQA